MLAPRVVPGLHSWIEAQRGIRRLGPLWSDLTAAFPLIALPTGRPLTLRRAELRYDRRPVEVGEGLALTRIPIRQVECRADDDPDGIRTLATLLRGSRSAWTQPAGVAANELLPATRDPLGERRQLLQVADAYASTRPSIEVTRPQECEHDHRQQG